VITFGPGPLDHASLVKQFDVVGEQVAGQAEDMAELAG
jgi:hypothetical protein